MILQPRRGSRAYSDHVTFDLSVAKHFYSDDRQLAQVFREVGLSGNRES